MRKTVLLGVAAMATLFLSACYDPCCSTCGVSDGGFACPIGQTSCPGGCADLMWDPTNCGACNNVCNILGGETCILGACEVVINFSDGGMPVDAGDSCGGCPSGQECCDGLCITTTADEDNCGCCGNSCNTGESCTNGACGCNGGPSCQAGEVCCATGCVDPFEDEENCGGCGIQCTMSTECTVPHCFEGFCDAIADRSLDGSDCDGGAGFCFNGLCSPRSNGDPCTTAGQLCASGPEPFGPCSGFTSECDETGEQVGYLIEKICDGTNCIPFSTEMSQSCTRSTTGTPCETNLTFCSGMTRTCSDEMCL